MNKRAQITLFIIIALVIIIAIGSYFIITKTLREPAEETPEQIEFEEQQQLKQYVDACLRPITLEGLEIIRLQGGYINIPDNIESTEVRDKDGYQINTINGIKQVTRQSFPNSNNVAYWVTKYNIQIPILELIEVELEEYITKELKTCVNDFKPFRDIGFDIQTQPITTDVKLRKAVVVDIDYPIKLKRKEIEFDTDRFNYQVPINFEKIYNLAKDLAGIETTAAYIERSTQNLISKYSYMGGQKERFDLPPYMLVDNNLDCNYVTWSKQDVKEKLRENFEVNKPLIKINKTRYEPFTSPEPLVQGVYDSFVYDLLETEYPLVEINFSYQDDFWMYLDIKPSQGDLIRPDKITTVDIPFVPQYCVFRYNYKYYLEYPTLAKITDYDSAKIDPISNTYQEKQGYTFQFPMYTFICGNQNRNCTGRSQYAVESEQRLEKFCNESGSDCVDKNYFCDDEQKLSGTINITTIDYETKELLPNINIYYYGGNRESDCFMGRTDSKGELKTKFPFCKNCILYMTSNTHDKFTQTFNTQDDQDKKLEFSLDKTKDFEVEFKLINLRTFTKNFNEGKIDGTANETAIGVINFEDEDSATVIAKGPRIINFYYPKKQLRNSSTLTNISISPGTYDIKLIANSNVTILDTEYDAGDDETVTVPGKHIEHYLLGSASFKWTVTRENIRDKKKIIFYIPVEYTSSALNPGNWKMIDDPITQTNRTIKAELLYRASILPLNLCSTDYRFITIDGLNQNDLSPGLCGRVDSVNIRPEQYLKYMKPRFE